MSDIVERLNVKPAMRDGEKINHLIRRLGIERAEAAAEITRLREENERLLEAIEEADISIKSLSNYADRAWRGEVDAGARELRRQIDCKFSDYWIARAVLQENKDG